MIPHMVASMEQWRQRMASLLSMANRLQFMESKLGLMHVIGTIFEKKLIITEMESFPPIGGDFLFYKQNFGK